MNATILRHCLFGAMLIGGLATGVRADFPHPPLPPLPSGLDVRITVDRPPSLRREHREPRPGPEYVWIAGYWEDDRGHWEWIPGRWELPTVPRARWIPARYVLTRHGTIYEPGHWSYQEIFVNDDLRRNRDWKHHQRRHRWETRRDFDRDRTEHRR